jgi:hypothetical protein
MLLHRKYIPHREACAARRWPIYQHELIRHHRWILAVTPLLESIIQYSRTLHANVGLHSTPAQVNDIKAAAPSDMMPEVQDEDAPSPAVATAAPVAPGPEAQPPSPEKAAVVTNGPPPAAFEAQQMPPGPEVCHAKYG